MHTLNARFTCVFVFFFVFFADKACVFERLLDVSSEGGGEGGVALELAPLSPFHFVPLNKEKALRPKIIIVTQRAGRELELFACT